MSLLVKWCLRHVTSTFGSLFQIDMQEAGNGPGFPTTKLMLKPITFNDVVSASLTSSMNIGDHIVTTPQYEAKGIQCELVKKPHLLHVPTAVLARARPQYANAFLLTGSSLYPPASRLSAVSAEARLMRQTAPTLATMRAHRRERYHRYAMSHKSESFIDLTCDADLRVIHLTDNTTPAASSSINVIDLTGDSTPGASGSNIIDLTHDDVSEASMDITNEIIDLTGDVV
ncbi:unnamed protein product [Somion occarium]|uniref:Uncharacterized protein n=1 Tax=Somion occarium TaxID=3059160 RepID=A0ABP1CS11_9APHY